MSTRRSTSSTRSVSRSEKSVSSECNANVHEPSEKPSHPHNSPTQPSPFKSALTRLRLRPRAVLNFFKFSSEEEEEEHVAQEMYPGEGVWDAFVKEHLGPRVVGAYVKDGDRFRMVQRVWE